MTASNGSSARAPELLETFLDASRTLVVVELDGSMAIRDANRPMLDLLKAEIDAIRGRPVADFLTEADSGRLERCAGDGGEHRLQLNFVDLKDSPQTLHCVLGPVGDGFVVFGERALEREDSLQRELLELNNTLAVLSRENSRRKRELERANAKLEDALNELNRSYWHLQKISEVLPICVECGQVKTGDDDGGWESVVDYLKKHSLFLSHGYCPECAGKLMAELNAPREGGP